MHAQNDGWVWHSIPMQSASHFSPRQSSIAISIGVVVKRVASRQLGAAQQASNCARHSMARQDWQESRVPRMNGGRQAGVPGG